MPIVGVQNCDLYFITVISSGIVLRKVYHGCPDSLLVFRIAQK